MKFTHTPLLSQAVPRWRGGFVLVLLMGSFLGLIGRSLYLQSIKQDFLQQKGESRYARTLALPATRGQILDRNGQVLAASTPVRSIWAIPNDASSLTPSQLRQLGRLLDMDVVDLNARFAAGKDFVYLKRQVAPDVAAQIKALALPGIHDVPEFRRYYPVGEVTAHVVGFTGAEDVGLEGVERMLQSSLAGTPGSRRVIRDRRGNVVEDVESIKEPQDGQDVVLSLDSKLQYLAFTALKQALAENRAKAGGIVVLDAKTGEILALANLPTYNPNNRSGVSLAQLRNRALIDSFEPGSTLKPFTVALALDQGKFRPETPVQTAPGRLTIGRATISDAHPHGMLTVAEVIQKSSNVGVAKIAATLSYQDMWRMFDTAGFGTPPRLGFPGESGGRLRPYKNWRPIEQATMSYGHGIAVSLMQLANSYLAFARDGSAVPLSLTRLDAAPSSAKRVFSARTAASVRAMLEMAVQDGGTAPKAQIAGYRVAGKTGTAYKIEGGQYNTKKYVSSFVGFAPASAPQLIVAVMIDEPGAGKHYGGEVAAPVFAQVMAAALRTLGVKPDGPMTPLQLAGAPPTREGL
ncbi:MAG: penicillin-binding protein 2 [Rhodocyclaceae bacterium]